MEKRSRDYAALDRLQQKIGDLKLDVRLCGLLPFVANLFLFSFFFHLTYSRWTSSLPSCLWSQRIFPSLPGSRLTFFLSRCKFSTLTTRQPMVKLYLLTFPRFPLRKIEHKSYLSKNRTHDFRTSRCAAYLLPYGKRIRHEDNPTSFSNPGFLFFCARKNVLITTLKLNKKEQEGR